MSDSESDYFVEGSGSASSESVDSLEYDNGEFSQESNMEELNEVLPYQFEPEADEESVPEGEAVGAMPVGGSPARLNPLERLLDENRSW